jgi:Tol biopolymer transport system component
VSAHPPSQFATLIRLGAMVASIGIGACTYNFDKFAVEQDANVGEDGSSNGTGGTAGSGTQFVGSGGAISASGGAASAGKTGTNAGASGSTGTGGAFGTGGVPTCVLGPFQAPELVTGLNRDSLDHFGPSISSDGSTLYFSGSDALTLDDIFTATRADRGARFSAAVALDSVNTTSADGSPSISNDGLTLYFYSTRPLGMGGRDIWSASRPNLQADFGTATLLAAVNGDSDDNLQWLSADELTIVFSSTRSGGGDLYIATRSNRKSAFSAPDSLYGINGATREDRAALSNDGLTIYFVSDRTGGLGDKDIWVATRTSPQGDFGNITNLEVVNSPQRDIDVALSSDEREIFFVSKRSGQFRLYHSIRNCQ